MPWATTPHSALGGREISGGAVFRRTNFRLHEGIGTGAPLMSMKPHLFIVMPASRIQHAAAVVGLIALFAGGCNLHRLNEKVGRSLSETVVSLGQRPGAAASTQHPVRECSTLAALQASPLSGSHPESF